MRRPERPDLPLIGGCACGAIRYRIAAWPLLLYTCSCTDCQRQSGSAFGMSMPTATSAFQITQGAPHAWRRLSPSGVPVTSWFCSQCSTRIYGDREGRPSIINIRAGTLDDTSWLEPVAHFFTRSAQSWQPFAATAACYETRPLDMRPLSEAWRVIMDDDGAD